MRFLMIGDIFGRPGRQMTAKTIATLKKEHELDYVIANGENMAHGAGMTLNTFQEMRQAGVDFFTTGNHIFKHADIFPEMEKESTLVIRPENFAPGNPGKGHQVVEVKGKKILILNLMGRDFMGKNYDCPFRAVDYLLNLYAGQNFEAIFVDMHAETTSEKGAMKHYLDGRVTALWGTHTHVPTADEQITEKGTAFITDLGMTGPMDSVIGARKEEVIHNFIYQTKVPMEVAEGPCVFNGILLESGNMKAIKIQRIQVREEQTYSPKV